MSFHTRSLLSALLALSFLFGLTAPRTVEVVDESALVPLVSSPAMDAAQDVPSGDAAPARVISTDSERSLDSDRSGDYAAFIKPQAAESAFAERGFDENHISDTGEPVVSKRVGAVQTHTAESAREPEQRQALLCVYRL